MWRRRDDDGLEPLVAPDGLVGPGFVQPPALGIPAALAVLKQRRRVAWELDRVERTGLELNANQRQQPATPSVACPENFVVPVGVFPPLPFRHIDPAEGRDESRLQPLATLVKKCAGMVDMDVFENLEDRPAQDRPGRQSTRKQDAGPNQHSHGDPPITSLIRAPSQPIVESECLSLQVTDRTKSFCSIGVEMPAAKSADGHRTGKSGNRKFGAHMSIAGGCDRAVWAAHAVGFATVQLFTKNNNQWRAPQLLDEHVAAFRAALDQTGVVDPIAHTSYLINLGSPDQALWHQSIDAMTVEVERCALLGIGDLVVHPGAHMGAGEEAGLARIAKALDQVHRRTRGLPVTIDLETTAGQGTNLGYRFEHLEAILQQVKDPERLGICVDTCHIFAAGYSLRTQGEYDEVIERLDRAVALERVRAWHVNDSVRDLGSRVDRHAAIGAGCMGLGPFRNLVNDPRFREVPLVLETPKGVVDGEDLDVRNLRVLRRLVRRAKSSGKGG
jgi:deoxyribonuclease-4